MFQHDWPCPLNSECVCVCVCVHVELTVFMCPQAVSGAAGAVSRRSETQHRAVVLCELLQPRHVAHMHTVLEVRSHCNHGDLLFLTWLPCQQLAEWEMGTEKEEREIKLEIRSKW